MQDKTKMLLECVPASVYTRQTNNVRQICKARLKTGETTVETEMHAGNNILSFFFSERVIGICFFIIRGQ